MTPNHSIRDDIRWGVIGSSGFAADHFAPAVVEAEGARLTAILGSEQAKAEAFAQKIGAERAYSDLEAFAADDGIDAVWIASPNHMHRRQAVACLTAGRHVLCEKPLATSSADGQAIIDAAKRSDRLITVGYNMRQDPLLSRVRQRYLDRVYGPPAFLRVNRFLSYPAQPQGWRTKWDTSGGWAINDLGTHLLDQLIWFLGHSTNVSGMLTTCRFDVDTDDLAVVQAIFENGAIGSIEASTGLGEDRPPRLELYGLEGWAVVEMDPFGSGVRLEEKVGDDEVTSEQVEPVNTYALQVEAFGRAIRGEEAIAVSAAQAVHNLEMIEQVRQRPRGC
jgi:1,5-anhydro-D-fructose reductase (1,5-anhydro-D-mannitol-forming)